MPRTVNATASASTAAMTSRRSFPSTRVAVPELKFTHGTRTFSVTFYQTRFDINLQFTFFFLLVSVIRKATFDMFNFLASQHRELPDIIGSFDEEEDEFPLKSSRLGD